MCFRTIHNYKCCGKIETYIHYPCLSVIHKELCQHSEGPNLDRTIPCSSCLPRTKPEPRTEITLHSSETLTERMIIHLEERRDDRRERVAALQVLAEVVFAMQRDGGTSDQTLGDWAGIFERIERLREDVEE